MQGAGLALDLHLVSCLVLQCPRVKPPRTTPRAAACEAAGTRTLEHHYNTSYIRTLLDEAKV